MRSTKKNMALGVVIGMQLITLTYTSDTKVIRRISAPSQEVISPILAAQLVFQKKQLEFEQCASCSDRQSMGISSGTVTPQPQALELLNPLDISRCVTPSDCGTRYSSPSDCGTRAPSSDCGTRAPSSECPTVPPSSDCGSMRPSLPSVSSQFLGSSSDFSVCSPRKESGSAVNSPIRR